MRTITGRFVRNDGKPAAHGFLRMELVAEECELHELSPIGYGAERYRTPVTEEMRKQWRTDHHWMSEHEMTLAEAEEFKPQYIFLPFEEFRLNADGCIPVGTQVLGNDELTGNTTYRATVDVPQQSCPGRDSNCFREEVRITGDQPVDIHEAVLREPEPEIAPLSSRELELAADAAIVRDGTLRLGKKNRIGFYAGAIHCPAARAESVSLPSLEQGVFGVLAFHLPMAALVNRASVLIDAAARGTLFIGVYDASGRKHCETEIDLSQSGLASGIFDTAVNLSEDDYFLAWATRTTWTGNCADSESSIS